MTAAKPGLFPRIEPFQTGFLDVGGGHRVFWEQSGNPEGVPVIFLHGGPGAGSNPSHRRFFSPSDYRIVIFDQRGAGRSTPFASVESNTTQDLINDIEKLRRHLEIDSWLVFGGSWGSTLALAYGIAHPGSCRGFILRGVFLGRRSEIDWFLYGIAKVYPEMWRRFSEALPEAERTDLLTNYHIRLTSGDPAVHTPAAEAWSRYESSCSTLLPASANPLGAGRGALSLARIEAHYFVNNVFLGEDHILANINRIQHLPATIVQGRYDMICPTAAADELHNAWPRARYVVVPDAGHSAMEPGIRSALVKAAADFAAPSPSETRVPR